MLTPKSFADGATIPPEDLLTGERLQILEDTEMVDAPSSSEVHSSKQPRQQTAAGKAHRPAASLARILFAACDVCLYCGGKFVG